MCFNSRIGLSLESICYGFSVFNFQFESSYLLLHCVYFYIAGGFSWLGLIGDGDSTFKLK